MTHVKICGVTSEQDAAMCVEAGADAIGLNFAPSSPRCLSVERAQAIRRVIPSHVMVVGVFVDAELETLLRVRDSVGLGCLQLHGDEPPELLAQLLPHAYKALRVRGPSVQQEAARFAGDFLLLDAYVPGVHGGSGARFDWNLALQLSAARKLILAGGLTPDNVAQAVAAVKPFCVDVASGVESAPGVKDPKRVRAFIEQAKSGN